MDGQDRRSSPRGSCMENARTGAGAEAQYRFFVRSCRSSPWLGHGRGARPGDASGGGGAPAGDGAHQSRGRVVPAEAKCISGPKLGAAGAYNECSPGMDDFIPADSTGYPSTWCIAEAARARGRGSGWHPPGRPTRAARGRTCSASIVQRHLDAAPLRRLPVDRPAGAEVHVFNCSHSEPAVRRARRLQLLNREGRTRKRRISARGIRLLNQVQPSASAAPAHLPDRGDRQTAGPRDGAHQAQREQDQPQRRDRRVGAPQQQRQQGRREER